MFSRSIRNTVQSYLHAGEATAPIDLAAVLAERLAGEVIAPDHHDEHETARRVWNGMIDKRPAAIARCADADDVATAVRFAAGAAGCRSPSAAAGTRSPAPPPSTTAW